MTPETPVQVPAREGRAADDWLLPVLVDAGVLTGEQSLSLQARRPTSAWRVAVEHGDATDSAIVEAVAAKYKVGVADLGTVDARVATLLPEATARKYQIVAIGADDRVIHIATADPRNLMMEQTLAFVTGRDVRFLVASPAALATKLDELYRPETAVNRLLHGLQPVAVETIDDVPAGGALRDPSLDAPMARLVDAMIADAVRESASDIHCEPLVDGTSVRYRIDGVLKEVMRLPASAGPALVRRVKILARLDVTDPLHPHDGRTAVRVDGTVVDLRVSTVPVARRGEKVVVRILDKGNLRACVADLTLPPPDAALVERLLGYREGIVLVTGPTGSGKTTTLYAALNQLRTGRVNIVTVEDPVEYDVPGISQLQVNDAQDFTFANALRSVLRQDPDIVMVSEIRGRETATIATQASLSGHLVLSTRPKRDRPPITPSRSRCDGLPAAKPAAGRDTGAGWRWWRCCRSTTDWPSSSATAPFRPSLPPPRGRSACGPCGSAASTGSGRASPRSTK